MRDVVDRFERLARAPAREGSVLDVPFREYAEDVTSPAVVDLLTSYARAHQRPTLRALLRDERLRRWYQQAKRTPVRLALDEELDLVGTIVEEEYVLEPEPEPEPEPEDSLARFAEQAGVRHRLDDKALVLAYRVRSYVLRSLVWDDDVRLGDLLGEDNPRTRSLPASARAELSQAIDLYIRSAGKRALRNRRADERVAKLAHVPPGDGARALLEAIESALARAERRYPAPSDVEIGSVSFEPEPASLEVEMSVMSGRFAQERTAQVSLVLEHFRRHKLEKRVTCDKKLAPVVLRAASRVLRDPEHPAYASLVQYASEPSWRRVLRKLEQEASPAGETAPMFWRITGGKEPRLSPCLDGATWEAISLNDVARGASDGDAQDEAIAKTLLAVGPYGHAEAGRAPVFNALSLLAASGDDRARDSRGASLRVVRGTLAVVLERGAEADGATFAVDFEVCGERLTIQDVAASLDASGFLIHVASARGVVLLAHVGRRAASFVQALASEPASYPADAARAIASSLVAAVPELGLRAPEELLGARTVADARPHVSVSRPTPQCFELAWSVRPLSGGPRFATGQGPETLAGAIDGQPTFTVRDRDEETKRARALQERLPGGLCVGVEAMLAVASVLRASSEADEAVVEWPKSVPRVVAAAKLSDLRVQVERERDWFGVRGEARVGDASVTLEDLLAAMRAHERFVVVGPDALVAIEDDLRARLEALDAATRQTAGGLALPHAAVPVLAEIVPRDQLDATDDFAAVLARIEKAAASDPRPPRGFGKVLRPYQLEGFRWMSRLAAWGAGGCLADEMGLGKTVQTLALLAARATEGPALVVAPTSVGPNWLAEVKRFAPRLKATLYRGAERAGALEALGPGDLLVTSYDIAARDREALSRVDFATLVADEAQAIKNGATARAEGMRSLRARFRLALTGTPVENRLSELHSLMEFLNPGFFGSEKAFRTKWAAPIERDGDARASAALAHLVRPLLLRRKKSEVLTELPARTEITRHVEAAPAERRLYEAARRTAIEVVAGNVDDERSRFRVLAEITRLRLLACHPRLYDAASRVPSAKLEAFVELARELREGGHRALVFSQFTSHLALVAEAVAKAGLTHVYLDGQTPLAERTRRVAAFQGGEGDLFLISLKAGGTGLNLTAADTVVHLDPWWNPAVEDQATDRAHRIGQTRPVTVVRLVSRGTIEEAVVALHEEKRELAEAILEGAATSGKLSVAELGALLRAGLEGAA